jgi:hypothetical protein
MPLLARALRLVPAAVFAAVLSACKKDSRRLLLTVLVALPIPSRAQPIAPGEAATSLQPVRISAICVTNGAVTESPGGGLLVETPSSRAVVPGSGSKTVEIRFRYLGPSQGSKPLASGEMRRQIGLKLRAQDTCNLLYAMWHIEPDSRIAVSVKRNPGKSTHQQCDARGYLNIKPERGAPPAPIRVNQRHSLRAVLDGTRLTLVADGETVWVGSVGNTIFEFDGPAGFRTDNARFELELATTGGGPAGHGHCSQSPGV